MQRIASTTNQRLINLHSCNVKNVFILSIIHGLILYLTININLLYVCIHSNFQNIIAGFSQLSKNYKITLQNSVKNVSWYFYFKTQTTFILEAQQTALEMSHHNLTYVETKYQNKTCN